MSTTIIQRTISAAMQKAISFSNSAIARSIPIPSGWNALRIGMRLHFTQGTFVSPVRWAFGLCHGTTNIINSDTTDNFAGVWSDSSFSSNGSSAGDVYFGINWRPMTRVGTLITTGTQIVASTSFGNTANLNTADRMPFFVDITKGSPNYTMNVWYPAHLGTAIDYSEDEFQTMLQEQSNPQRNGADIMSHGTDQTIAVDEAGNGALNALSVWWNQIGPTLEVCDLGFAIFS